MYTALAVIGFLALVGIVLYFVFFKSGGSNASVPSENALIQSERSNTYDTSKSTNYGQEEYNYTKTSTNYAYYSGA
jgi:hypothetical protein